MKADGVQPFRGHEFGLPAGVVGVHQGGALGVLPAGQGLSGAKVDTAVDGAHRADAAAAVRAEKLAGPGTGGMEGERPPGGEMAVDGTDL